MVRSQRDGASTAEIAPLRAAGDEADLNGQGALLFFVCNGPSQISIVVLGSGAAVGVVRCDERALRSAGDASHYKATPPQEPSTVCVSCKIHW